MRVKQSLFAAVFPWMVGTLPDSALADVQAVLACRRLPPGPERASCLERASATLAQERAGRASPAAPSQFSAYGGVRALGFRSRLTAGVESITYQDGRPVFRLDNGQTWYSTDRRHLTFKPGRSHVTIEKTPVGMLLHYNGSFFALQVVPKEG